MYKLGRYNKLRVDRVVDFGIYLEDDEENSLLLPKWQVPEGTEVGDELNLFVYKDSEDRAISTTVKPKGVVSNIVALKVVDVNKVGAFLDWGLDKDLMLPFKNQFEKVEQDTTVLVRILHDKTSDRIVATTKCFSHYDISTKELHESQKVELLIYDKHELGVRALINNQYLGLIFEDEIFEDLEVGDLKIGYIKEIRYDSKINLTLKPQNFSEAVLNDKLIILEKLKNADDNHLPLTAKSSPEDIRFSFNLSKKAFKKAIGGLYKDRKIVVTEHGIELNVK